jgi:parallel beta-helix repeat protein
MVFIDFYTRNHYHFGTVCVRGVAFQGGGRLLRPGIQKLLVCLLCVAICAIAGAADYYVDATGGLDTNDGQSPERAWRSLGKVTGFAFAPGDRVFFKRGETWRGQLRITRSGTAEQPIVYGAYGAGERPILNGSALVTNWTAAGVNRWTSNIASRVERAFFSGNSGNRRATADAVSAPGDWHWAGGVFTVYSVGIPTEVEASYDLATLLVTNSSYVNVGSLHVIRGVYPVWIQNTTHVHASELKVEDGAGYAGIYIVSVAAGRGRNNIIRQCEVLGMLGTNQSRNNGSEGSGIYIQGNGHAGANQLLENVLHDNGHEGIQVGESDANLIRGNIVYNHGQSGIRLGLPACTGNIIEHNLVYGNARAHDDRYGIDLINVGNGNIVRYNVTHGQEVVQDGPYHSGGIRFDGNNGVDTILTESTGNAAYYNLVYDEHIGINVYSFSNVAVVHNTVVDTKVHGIAVNAPEGIIARNVVVGNNIVAPASGSAVAHVNIENAVINRNAYLLRDGAYFVWGLAFVPWNTYRALSGQDAESLVTDPLFADPAARDYRLLEHSPVRDMAAPMGLTRDIDGNTVPYGDAPDIGAYEYTYVPPAPEGEGEGVGDGEGAPDGEGIAEGSVDGDGALDEGEGGEDGEHGEEGEGAADGASDLEGEGDVEGEGIREGAGEGALDGEGGDMEGEGEATEAEGEGIHEAEVHGDGEGEGEGHIEGIGEAEDGTGTEAEEEGEVPAEGELPLEGEGASDGEGALDGEGAYEGDIEGDGEGDIEGDGEGDGEDPSQVPAYHIVANVTEGPVPLEVTFEAWSEEKQGAVYFEWDFGDGHGADGHSVQHTYHTPGIYTVTLEITTESDQTMVESPGLISATAQLPAAGGAGLLLATLAAVISGASALSRRR